MPKGIIERKEEVTINDTIPPEPVKSPETQETLLRHALHLVGKNGPEDELNCGGCGYDSCREFAAALLEGKAEPAMCVSFLRKQAQKKANALLRCMPSGVAIVDGNLSIIECNQTFAKMFGEDTFCAFEASPGLEGASLEKIVPFADLFRSALASGRDIRRENLRVGNRLLNVNIFSIEQNKVVGAIVQDVTNTEVRREQIANRAREVIDKNLLTVQEIACRLGEHMADTEMLLRSIAEDYGVDDIPEDMVEEK